VRPRAFPAQPFPTGCRARFPRSRV
jgi:hypothetical protein